MKSIITNELKWIEYDFYDLETRPEHPDKYLICRKDGKVHWETWNGSGWAYNHNSIKYWAKFEAPIKIES